MPIQKGQVLNPKGNPNMNIGKARKTGPRTDLGKLKVVVLNTGIKRKTKLLGKFMHCSCCPLGQRKVKYVVDGKEKEQIRPPMCPQWDLKRKKCVIDVTEYISKLKDYFKYFEKFDGTHIMKMLAFEGYGRYQWNEMIEMLKTGMSGRQSGEDLDRAIGAIEKAHKMEQGVADSTATEFTINIVNAEDVKKVDVIDAEIKEDKPDNGKEEHNMGSNEEAT